MVIKNNFHQGTVASDLYKGGVTILDGGLDEESEIGVWTNAEISVCSNISETDAGYFFSNDDNFVKSYASPVLKLVAK